MAKKVLVWLLLGAIIAGVAYFMVRKPAAPVVTVETTVVKPNSGNAFSDSMAAAVGLYSAMAEAFVLEDSAAANRQSQLFTATLRNLPAPVADSLAAAGPELLRQKIIGFAEKIPGTADWTAKRRAFQLAGDAFYEYLKLVPYEGGQIYRQFCPMAFNDSGASWLSTSTVIRNPYFGNKMLSCGEVQDSLRKP